MRVYTNGRATTHSALNGRNIIITAYTIETTGVNTTTLIGASALNLSANVVTNGVDIAKAPIETIIHAHTFFSLKVLIVLMKNVTLNESISDIVNSEYGFIKKNSKPVRANASLGLILNPNLPEV